MDWTPAVSIVRPRMGILDDMGALVDEFTAIPEWEARYRRIIEMGQALPPMDESLKTEDNRQRGCASAAWLYARTVKDSAGVTRIAFDGWADAIISRGLVAILLKVYNHRTPREILGAPPDFIEDLGLNVNLGMNRANGIATIAARIQEIARENSQR